MLLRVRVLDSEAGEALRLVLDVLGGNSTTLRSGECVLVKAFLQGHLDSSPSKVTTMGRTVTGRNLCAALEYSVITRTRRTQHSLA